MNSFVSNIASDNLSGHELTTNGMKTRVSSKSSVLDLFFWVGASRNSTPEDRINNFLLAYNQDPELAIRVMLWSRDVREGEGQRDYFREVFAHLCISQIDIAKRILAKIPELGRWDDVFVAFDTPIKHEAIELIKSGIAQGDALLFKWLPREKSARKDIAVRLMKELQLSQKQYRKLIVSGSETVEQAMCSKQWDKINYSHVPSKAAQIYSKAFNRNDSDRYQEYLATLIKKDDPTVKINAGAIYPHDVIKSIYTSYHTRDNVEDQRVLAQWDALPNYMDDTAVLPMIDVSGSMSAPAGGSTSITCLQAALAIGLYIADKSQGAFKDVFLNFSTKPTIQHLPGNILEKLRSIDHNNWTMSTNIEAAFERILEHAVSHKVPESDMPKVLIILSDMQFDCATINQPNSASKLLKGMYKEAGYEVPSVVYWNINGMNGVPVKMDKSGAALVSGFSPSILKSVLSSIEDLTPMNTMLNTIMNDRYSF